MIAIFLHLLEKGSLVHFCVLKKSHMSTIYNSIARRKGIEKGVEKEELGGVTNWSANKFCVTIKLEGLLRPGL